MLYTNEDIKTLDRITRLKLINSVSGVKSANLIGTIADNGETNLAIFSSVVHIGSDPALLGFIARPQTEDVGHTYANIKEINEYTINHVHPEFVENAHYTSAKFEKELSEFDSCGLTEEFISGFKAPFVEESNFKMGMLFKEAIDIKINGTVLIIGEIQHLSIAENALIDNDIDLAQINSVAVSGLNSYYSLKKIAHYPYARVPELPLL